MAEDEPLAHIARSVLPWRDSADNDTECGKAVSQFAKVITWDEATAIVKKHGRQRAAFMLCMTCAETTHRHGYADPLGQLTFDGAPRHRLDREHGARGEQLDRELRAMAEIVSNHREEFDDLLSGHVVPIAELRRTAKNAKRRATSTATSGGE